MRFCVETSYSKGWYFASHLSHKGLLDPSKYLTYRKDTSRRVEKCLKPPKILWVGSEKRRHDRYLIRLPVELLTGKDSLPAETVDVSFGGLFIKTASPPPQRQLVKVKLNIPPRDLELMVMAMAVFVGQPKPNETMTGVGLKLFGLDVKTQQIWEQFVRHVQTMPKTEIVSPDKSTPLPLEEAKGPWSALLPELRIITKSLQDLEKIVKRDFKRGRIYVRTNTVLTENTKVEIQLVHPLSNTTYIMTGIVDKNINTSDFRGLKIKLPQLTDIQKKRISSFFKKGSSQLTIDIDSEALADPSLLEPGH